jgi:hypothetical protein
MKIPPGFAQLLQKMINGDQPGYGAFQGSNRKLLEQFITDGALDYIPVGSQQKKIICRDTSNLKSYLHNKHGIPSLEDYIAFQEKENTTRSDAVKATSNSKYKNIKVFEGFLINTYQKIDCMLNGIPFVVNACPGTFTFINNFRNFTIPPNITIVGVEGFENFKEIKRQKYLFENIQPLFVWRYQSSSSISSWLNLIPNNYLHFGDYDPKGLHIYASEFQVKIGADRCRFFIPENLESLLTQYGERELYENQIEYLRKIDFNEFKDTAEVFQIIERHKKGLAQEALIK